MNNEQCVCGREKRAACPKCGKFVGVAKGRYVSHETSHCTGSHMEYKTCPGSNTEVKT